MASNFCSRRAVVKVWLCLPLLLCCACQSVRAADDAPGTFFRGLNLNGPSVTIDGYRWDGRDVNKEDDATLDAYALKRGANTGFGWQCLVARRLAERGVRFIELIDTGSRPNWDSHGEMKEHAPLAKAVDQPITALLQDLKRRDMLDDTLVVWATEFGRTPTKEGKHGRGHHGDCFSVWLAGGGIKGGIVMAKPTRSANQSSEIKWKSTTCTQRSCTCLGSITQNSPTATPAETSG